MARVFAALMPHASGRVALADDDEFDRLGFAIYSGPTLYFVYVAEKLRGEGIVPEMLEGLSIERYAFTTYMGERRLKPADRGWRFCPRFTLGDS
jgi:hypothetical protein